MDHVDYDTLDAAKNDFINACKQTTQFARDFGFIPNDQFGASANVFELDLSSFFEKGQKKLHITLLPEGLGTADDARPEDLNSEELQEFWYNIGIKTMGVLTNDAASSGMQTVLISLYLPSARPEIVFNEDFRKGFLSGFIDGCKAVGCVYFSGETPQLKNKIVGDKLDIAGALFGLMPAGIEPIDGTKLESGDEMIFVASTGPDANGFTSLRELAEKLPDGYRTKLPSGKEYWQAINNPTVLLTPCLQEALKSGVKVSNVEPISGHGWQKIMRNKTPLKYIVNKMLDVPEIFQFVQEQTNTSPAEMIKIFNYGLGFVVFVKSSEDREQFLKIAEKHGLTALHAGHVEASETREVVVNPLNTTLSSENFALQQGS